MSTVRLICSDRGQHTRRDLVRMIEIDAEHPMPRVNSPIVRGVETRWHASAWLAGNAPLAELGERRTVLPLNDSIPTDRSADRRERRRGEADKLIRANVLVFVCPSCQRRPRWRREKLDRLCDATAATDTTGFSDVVLDLSQCE
jgi:hypothetical protein